MGLGAVLGLQGGTNVVMETIQQVKEVWGNLSDVAGVWLQDWTGQRNFTAPDFPRTGLWWNWEVCLIDLIQGVCKLKSHLNRLIIHLSFRLTPPTTPIGRI